MENTFSKASGHIWNSEPEVGLILGSIIIGGQYTTVIELGFFKGVTSEALAAALDLRTTNKHEKKLILVDITNEYFTQESQNELRENCENTDVTIEIGDSIKVLKKYPKNFADLIFIDTTHTLEQTRLEFKEAERIIKTNGIIALHDSISHHGVGEWVAYIKQFNWFEVITIPTSNGNGLTLVKCLMKK